MNYEERLVKAVTFLKNVFLFANIIGALNYSMAGTWADGQYTGSLGIRNYKTYIPNNLDPSKKHPVVIMLHGCEQSAQDFATGTRIEKWADKFQFIALFPEQNINYNPFKCWNWVIPGNNSRFGEAQIIITMLEDTLKKYNGNSKKVFAAGMSAGASMTSILGNCYPEYFLALASHDGTQFYSSYTGLDFAEVVLNGASVPALTSAIFGNACSRFSSSRPIKMPIIIFHGLKSPLMGPIHAFQVETEFKIFNDFLDNGKRDNSYFLEKNVITVPDSETYGYSLFTTTNQSHDVFIERYMINDLAHGWSGGVANLPYNDPKGPDASALIFTFFKKYGL